MKKPASTEVQAQDRADTDTTALAAVQVAMDRRDNGGAASADHDR